MALLTPRMSALILVSISVIAAVTATVWAASTYNWPFCVTRTMQFTPSRPTIENLTRPSETILLGHVQSVGSSWKSVDEVYTASVLNVTQYIKGSQPGNTVQVRTIGGTVGCYTVLTNDASLHAGTEVLLFLVRDESRMNFQVSYGSFGAFTVTNGTVYSTVTNGTMTLDALIAGIRRYL